MKGALRGNHARSDDAMYGEPRAIVRRKSKVEFNEHDSTTSDDDVSDDDDDDDDDDEETPDEADSLFISTRNKTSVSLSNKATAASDTASASYRNGNNKTSEPSGIKHLVSSTGLFPVRSDGWRRASLCRANTTPIRKLIPAVSSQSRLDDLLAKSQQQQQQQQPHNLKQPQDNQQQQQQQQQQQHQQHQQLLQSLRHQTSSTSSKMRSKSLNMDMKKRETTERVLSGKRIMINVGGTRFETYRSTLRLLPETRLAQLSPTNSDFDSARVEYFFDRDPSSFAAILNYYRTGKLHVPNDVCGNLFFEELNFWGIGERSIQPCCWTTYSTKRDCDEILQKVMDDFEEGEDEQWDFYHEAAWEDRVPAFSNITNKDSVIRFPRENKKNWFFRFITSNFSRIRPVIWKILDDRSSSNAAAFIFWVSVVFLAISIFNFVLGTSPYCRVPYDVSTDRNLTRRDRDLNTAPHPILTKVELTCNIFFAIEYVLRFLSSPDKRKFVKNPYNFLEFLAIMPLFWPAETLENKRKHPWGTRVHNYIEVFYILRILRIFTLVPKYSGLRVLLLTLKNSIGELILYMMMLFMTIMIFASFIFYAEQIFEKEDNKFDSILIGLWWAIVTMTTLGYGDIVPVTPVGYIVGGMCALCGLIFMALPIPVIVNSFTTFYAHAKAREKLRDYSEIQKNLPNKAVAIQFHSCDNRCISAHNKLPINSVNTLSKYEDEVFVDGKYKIKTDDITQVVVSENSRRTVKCNPFAKKQTREKQNISHDAKSKAIKDQVKLIDQLRLKRRNAI